MHVRYGACIKDNLDNGDREGEKNEKLESWSERILAKKEPCFWECQQSTCKTWCFITFRLWFGKCFIRSQTLFALSVNSISSSPSHIVSKPANHFRLCHYHSFSYRLRILAVLIYNYNHSYLYVRWCYWDIHKALNIAKVLVFNSLEGFHFLGYGCLIIPND